MNNPEYAQALRDLNTLHCRDLQSHFALRGENRVAAQLALANAINKSKSAVVVKKVSYSAVHPPRQLKFSVHAGKETTNEASHMQTNGPNHLRYYGWQEGVGLPSVADEKALREIGFLKLRQRAQNYQEWTSGASACDPSRTVDAVIAQDALDMILALKNIVKTRGLVDFTKATDLAQNFSVLVQTNGSKLDKKELKAIYTLVMQIVNGDDGIIDAVKPPVKDLTAIGGVLTASGQTIADILRTKGDDVPPQELGTFNAPEVVQKEHDEMGAEGRAEAVAKEERKEDAQAEGTVDLEPEPVNPTAAVPAPGAAPIPVPAGAPIAPHGLPPPVAPIRIPEQPKTPKEGAHKDWAFESEEEKEEDGEHMYTPTAQNASAASLSGLPRPEPMRPVATAEQAAAHAASAMQAAEAPRVGAEAAAAQEAAVPTASLAASMLGAQRDGQAAAQAAAETMRTATPPVIPPHVPEASAAAQAARIPVPVSPNSRKRTTMAKGDIKRATQDGRKKIKLTSADEMMDYLHPDLKEIEKLQDADLHDPGAADAIRQAMAEDAARKARAEDAARQAQANRSKRASLAAKKSNRAAEKIAEKDRKKKTIRAVSRVKKAAKAKPIRELIEEESQDDTKGEGKPKRARRAAKKASKRSASKAKPKSIKAKGGSKGMGGSKGKRSAKKTGSAMGKGRPVKKRVYKKGA